MSLRWMGDQLSSFLGSAAFYIVAIIVVVGLFGLAFWLMRRNPLEAPISGRRGNRLAVIETLELGKGKRLMLVRRDGAEHLLLLGESGDLVVEPQIGRGRPAARPEPQLRGERPARSERPPAREAPAEPAPPPPVIPDREQRRQAIAQRLRRAGGEPVDLDESPIPFPNRRNREVAGSERAVAPVRRSPPAPLPEAGEPDYADRLRLRSSTDPDALPEPIAASTPEPAELFETEEEPEAEIEAFVPGLDEEIEPEPAVIADPEPGPPHASPRRADSPFAPVHPTEEEAGEDPGEADGLHPAEPRKRAAKPVLPSSEEPIRPPAPARPAASGNPAPETDEMEDEIARLFGDFPNPRTD